MINNDKKIFIYTKHGCALEVSIDIPYNSSTDELAYILILKYNLPIFVANDLIKDLSLFIEHHTSEYHKDCSTSLIQKTKRSDYEFEDATREWEKIMRDEMSEYGERRCASDEELFATAYHKMVHSPALETMLQLEHMYAQTVRQRCEEKDVQVNDLSESQTKEMSYAVERLEEGMTEIEINELAAKHFEDQTFLQVKLASELDTLKEAQRREYREWLMQMLEQNQANSSLPTPKSSPLAPVPLVPSRSFYADNTRNLTDSLVLEESFTIHLGSQLKQMHNIRILRTNVMNLCSVNEKSAEPTPQILQTALALYSNDLHGLVLITDNIVRTRPTDEFRKICQRSTEFHFQHVDDQLDKINSIQQRVKHESEVNSLRSGTKHLQPGDFYMTRHSNLAQVHVIFHIVGDDGLRGTDINSRHPVVLGLRNIVKTACSNDVTSLTIPLLLTYEVTEDMTISWCEKRAELVFKCVKGFMIEMASWGGSDLKNLQFMLPKGISSEVFQSLTEMLPRIFKVSNPLILKSSK